MADDKNADHSSGRSPHILNEGHRTNDVAFGHLGRISYIPGDNEVDQGELLLNRDTQNTPFLRHISPFTQWYAPTKGAPEAFPPATSPWRVTRDQRHWLLKQNPESFMGNLGLGSLLHEDAVASLHPSDTSTTTFSLLSVGEISEAMADTKPDGSVRGVQALSCAVGEASHILRVSRLLQSEGRLENGQPGRPLKLRTVETCEEGFWFSDVTPIQQIKFARSERRFEQLRWLIVQKASGTFILEPRLGKMLVPRNSAASLLPSGGPEFISIHQVAALDLQDTDGSRHLDVSFNPASGSNGPQLAVIDQSGFWRVWDIARSRRPDRPSRLHLKKIGKVNSLLMPQPSFKLRDSKNRVLWAGRPSQGESPGKGNINADNLSVQPITTSSGLLLVSDLSSVQVIDTRAEGTEPWGIFRLKRNEELLDMQISPSNPAHVFILTRDTLSWIELRSSVKSGVQQWRFLMSCPNIDHRGDGTLKLAITPTEERCEAEAYTLVVYSALTARATFHHFAADADGHAKFYRQMVHLPTLTSDASIHLQTLLLIPAAYTDNYLQVYQLLCVFSDLSLNASLCAFSSREDRETPRFPDSGLSIRPSELESRERKALSRLERVFVVLDELETGRHSNPNPPEESLQLNETSLGEAVVPVAIDLGFAYHKLFQKSDLAIGIGSSSEKAPPTAPFDHIRDAIASSIEQMELPLKTLLELAGRAHFTVDVENDMEEWTHQTAELLDIDDDQLTAHETMRGRADLALGDLYRSLFSSWTAGLGRSNPGEEFLARQKLLIAYIASRVFLSQFGLAITPERLLKDAQPSLPAIFDQLGENIGASPSSFSQDGFSLSTPSHSPSSPFTESSVRSRRSEEPESEREDPAVTRLRQYCPSIRSVAPREEGPTLLLSNWEVGTDPWEYKWVSDPSRQAAEAMLRRRRLADEARRRRRAEKIQQLKVGSSQAMGDPFLSQHMPTTIQSSQPWALHPPSSPRRNLTSSPGPVTMSQPVAGTHATRPQAAKKKKSKPSRTSGFR